jgi:hydrogenase expression/formation protein HypC
MTRAAHWNESEIDHSATESNSVARPEGDCHMCLAIPGKIVQVFADDQSAAMVEVAGVRRRVDLGLLEQNKPGIGDWVLIHVGFAMSRISEEDALEQMRTLTALGEAQAAINEVRGYGLEEPSAEVDS